MDACMDVKSESGLACQGHFPLRFSVIQEGDMASQYAQYIALNEERLNTLLRLDDYRPDRLDDGSAGLSPELKKLDCKLNLMLEMLSQLMALGAKAPEAIPVALSSYRLSWATNQVCGLGDWLRIELYLHTGYPFPIVLFGQIDVCVVHGADFQLEIALSVMPEQQQELYDKFLFRCHRRDIARTKKYG